VTLSRRAAWVVVIVATTTMTVSYVDRTTLAVLAPSVTHDLDIGETTYGWLLSAFSIAYLFGTPLGGWWIDRVGARRGLVLSLLAWSAIAAAHAIVPGVIALFALRLALGLAEGPSFPGAAQTVQRALDVGDRARGFGVLFTGSSIGGLLAPIAAGALFDLAGWRVAFLVTSAAGLIWIPLWVFVTGGRAARATLDAAPATAPPARPPLGHLLSQAWVIRALCGVFAAAPLVGFVQGWGAKYLALEFGVKQGAVGHFLWLPPLVFDAGAVLFGDLASRLPRAVRPMFALAMLLGASIGLLPLAHTPWQAMVFASTALAGAGGLYTLLTADLLSRISSETVSFAGGVIAGAQSLALIIMSPIVGASVRATDSYTSATITLGLWVLPGSLIWLVWRPRSR
jgi:ACS family hexuronate transporter-like MFS transporter